ncbi:hypothetical protein WG66_016277 [Moniliophthora roreri]|nr:hypothetical protein WG66_016277 [Moniliophthora roreri]
MPFPEQLIILLILTILVHRALTTLSSRHTERKVPQTPMTLPTKDPKSVPHLPFEITDKIIRIRHLVQVPFPCNHDNRNILACSQVSRAWVGPARRYIWDSYCITIPQSKERFQDLKNLYASSPLNPMVQLMPISPHRYHQHSDPTRQSYGFTHSPPLSGTSLGLPSGKTLGI